MRRRNIQLLDWYGTINYDNEPDKEKSKFKWLHEQGVITKEEMEIKTAQIESASLSVHADSSRLLN